MPLNLTFGGAPPPDQRTLENRKGRNQKNKWADHGGLNLGADTSHHSSDDEPPTAQQVIAAVRAAFVVDSKGWADRAGIDLDSKIGDETEKAEESHAAPPIVGWDPLADPTEEEVTEEPIVHTCSAALINSMKASAVPAIQSCDDGDWDPFADPADAEAKATEEPMRTVGAPEPAKTAAFDAPRPAEGRARNKPHWAEKLQRSKPPLGESAVPQPCPQHPTPAAELSHEGPSLDEFLAGLDALDRSHDAHRGGDACAKADRGPQSRSSQYSDPSAAATAWKDPGRRSTSPRLMASSGSSQPACSSSSHTDEMVPGLEELLSRLDAEDSQVEEVGQSRVFPPFGGSGDKGHEAKPVTATPTPDLEVPSPVPFSSHAQRPNPPSAGLSKHNWDGDQAAVDPLMGATSEYNTWGIRGSMAKVFRHTNQAVDMEALHEWHAGTLPVSVEPSYAETEGPKAPDARQFFIQRPRLVTKGGASVTRPEQRSFGQGFPGKLKRGATSRG